MIEVDWLAPIYVSRHAVERIAERLGVEMSVMDVRQEVRLALLEDRYSETQPNWTRGVSSGKVNDDARTIYAWDGSAVRCWAIEVMPREAVVKTLLLEKWYSAAIADSRRIRTGMQST